MRGFEVLRAQKKWAVKLAAIAAVSSVMGTASIASAATPPPATKVDNQFFDWFVNATPG